MPCMVMQDTLKGKTIYVCEGCGFGYSQKAQALACEEFCKRMSVCSTELTKLAVRKPIA